MSAVSYGLGGDHFGIGQLVDYLLESQKIRIFTAEDKVTDLGGRHGKADTVQHVEYDKFIESQRVLYHNFLTILSP